VDELVWGPSRPPSEYLAGGFDASITDVFVNFQGRISRLDPFAPGVTLLLGKNGSGKSSLLNSIANFGTEETSRFPDVTLRFQLPSVEETLAYWDFVEHHPGFEELTRSTNIPSDELGSELRKCFGLPVVETVITSLDRSYQGFLLKIDDKRYSASSFLRHFAIPESEISAFESRQARHLRMRGNQLDQSNHLKMNYRDYFCEFLLSLVMTSRTIASDTDEEDLAEAFQWEPDARVLFSREWLRDSTSQNRLVTGLRELFEAGVIDISGLHHSPAPHPAYSMLDSHECFYRFVGDIRDGSGLSDLTRRFSEKRSEHDRQFPLFVDVPNGEQVEVLQPVGFPYDLFTRSRFRADEVVTLSFPLRHRSRSFMPFQLPASPFVAIRSLPGNATADDSTKTLKSLLRWQSQSEINQSESVDRDPTDEDNADVLIDMQARLTGGLAVEAVLGSASEILRKLDIGVYELKLNLFVDGQHIIHQQPWADQGKIIDGLSVVFRSSPGASWQALEQASDGQVTAIFVVLQLLTLLEPLKSRRLKPALSILLADEFDRHLHPTTSETLLAEMHAHARRAGVSVLVSTHSVPLFQSYLTRSCPRLYAVRDVDGSYEVGSQPVSGLFGISSLLGTSEAQARSTAKLHLVVEGEIDERILKKLLFHPRIPTDSVEVLTLSGIRNLEGVWRSSLKYLTAPVLIVYDKKSNEFEKVWNDHVRKNPVEFKEQQDLRLLELALIKRKKEQKEKRQKMIEGDEELDALVGLARSVLDPQRVSVVREQVERLHFCGLGVPDILWCLPIDLFKRSEGLEGPNAWVPDEVQTWPELVAHSDRDSLTGDSLKKRYGITLVRVDAVLHRMDERDMPLDHPELLTLLATVIGLVEIDEDPRLGGQPTF